jgi:hypothetical protein
VYTQQWYMSYRFADSLRAGSGWNCSSILILLDDGQWNCPKHVVFYSKNKFEKLVHLVGFIVRKANKFLLILLLSSDSAAMLLFFLASLNASHCIIYLLPLTACFASTPRCMQTAADSHCPLVPDFSNCLR